MRGKPIKAVLFSVIVTILVGGCSGEKEEQVLQEAVLEEPADEEAKKQEEPREEAGIWVYVCGQVTSPGVYEIPEGTRIYQALEKAGGATAEASLESLNLAESAADGQKIYVPSREEAAASDIPGEGAASGFSESGSGGRVNLNTADKEQLMTLTGIGETRAEAILEYREQEGHFQSAEDIMNVQGIKEGIYEQIKDDITV